jgi:hypothetical protein
MERRRPERRAFDRRPYIAPHIRRQRAANRRRAIGLGCTSLVLGALCLALMRWVDGSPMADATAASDPRLFATVIVGLSAFTALVLATLAASES